MVPFGGVGSVSMLVHAATSGVTATITAKAIALARRTEMLLLMVSHLVGDLVDCHFGIWQMNTNRVKPGRIIRVG